MSWQTTFHEQYTGNIFHEINIFVIFFYISERGEFKFIKRVFYQFLFEILKQIYILYSWVVFFSDILTMALRIVKSGYLKRFSSKSLTVVLKSIILN